MSRPPTTLHYFSLIARLPFLAFLMCDVLFQLTSSFTPVYGFSNVIKEDKIIDIKINLAL